MTARKVLTAYGRESKVPTMTRPEAPDYPIEILSDDEDDGTMPANVAELERHIVGHKIVNVTLEKSEDGYPNYGQTVTVITLDSGKRVILAPDGDCCAYTELESFLLNVGKIDHIIMGVGTTDRYSTWHIYADFGDIMEMKVGWSAGNTGYYGYGFAISVVDEEMHNG